MKTENKKILVQTINLYSDGSIECVYVDNRIEINELVIEIKHTKRLTWSGFIIRALRWFGRNPFKLINAHKT